MEFVYRSDPDAIAGSNDNKQPEIKWGTKVMLLFKGGFIRNKKGSFRFIDEDHAYINISFSIKTGNNTFSPTFGTQKVKTNVPLPMQNLVLMPLTPIEDYFSITVNVIEENELQAAQQKISQIIPSANNIAGKIPVIGSTASTAIGMIGDITNMIVALSPENAVINAHKTFIVDRNNYPDIDMEYLKLGTMDFVESGSKHKDNNLEYFVGDDISSRLTLELVAPKNIPPAPQI